MESKVAIYTELASEPIGPYSQAVQCGNLIFISGQIPINPITNELDNSSMEAQVRRVFENIKAICHASNSDLQNILKVNLYLTNLQDFDIVNQVMQEYFQAPYPARACVEVSKLPKNVNFEAEAVLVLKNI